MTTQTNVMIYTVSGELVQTLNSQNAVCVAANTAGMTYCWDGRNQMGNPVATGIYLYVIQQGNQVLQEGKLLLAIR